MRPTLTQGTAGTSTTVVTETMTVPHAPGDHPLLTTMPRVFATAALVAFVEGACMELVAPHLDDGEITLGTVVDLTHSAPTPVGATVRAEVVVTHVEPRSVSFSVTVLDDEAVISVGTHTRSLIPRDLFDRKVAEKTSRLGLA